MTSLRLAISVVAGLSAIVPGRAATVAAPDRCGWVPPSTRSVQRVKTIDQLNDAVASAKPDTTILVADGDYRLTHTLEISTPHLVLRGASGDRARVVIRGAAMTENRVGVAIGVGAPDVTIADLTVGYVGYHGIQIRGERGASRTFVHNVRVVDTGQQLVKGSVSSQPVYADQCTIACSLFEYSDAAPSNYTNGLDVLAGKAWTVRDNTFKGIHGPASARWQAGPAILFWANSQDTVVEGNLVVDSFRGIALGLGPGASNLARAGEKTVDHTGGIIRNNVVLNLSAWADEGIEANAAPGVVIERNTVMVAGTLDWSISARFPATVGLIRDNLTNRPVVLRNGGHATLQGNIETAKPEWFVDLLGLNLRLSPQVRRAYPRVGADPADAAEESGR